MGKSKKKQDVPLEESSSGQQDPVGNPLRVHYIPKFFICPPVPVKITVIGVGGTGSQLLNYLARMNMALLTLGKPGIVVEAWDDDLVSPANCARQLFFHSEIGQNKAVVMIQRINRLYGFRWQAIPVKMDGVNDKPHLANIIIGCVDNMKARKIILDYFDHHSYHSDGEYTLHYYIDSGNVRDQGQIIMGSKKILQPPSKYITVGTLPTFKDLFGDEVFKTDNKNVPSCSLAEALRGQDLFINSFMAVSMANLLWRMFNSITIQYHGFFINTATGITTPIGV